MIFILFLTAIKLAIADTVSYEWTITNTSQNLDGVTRFALGVNGNPGYLTPIIVNKGDKIIVKVKNGLDVPTSLHWHGMFQKGSVEMDGPVGK